MSATLLHLMVVLACATENDAGTHEDFERWADEGDRRVVYNHLDAWLAAEGVGDIVPTWHLLRQGTDWEEASLPAFAIPPRHMWPAMVPTLVLIRDEVVPRVGAVEVVSGFRTDRYNAAAGGSSGSRHKQFEAVDLMLSRWRPRWLLHGQLRGWYAEQGDAQKLGLGMYSGVRFHVDTWRYRTWGG
jgi:hypothetical protein